MMAGLPVAAVAAALYLVLMAVHLLFPSPVVHALVLAMLMSAGARLFAFMFSAPRADTRQVWRDSQAGVGESVLANDDTPQLSADEEERLISQLESELDLLEKRYRRELTSMQLAARKSAGPWDERGRL